MERFYKTEWKKFKYNIKNNINMVYLKFLYWKDQRAFFRPATRWERIKHSIYYFIFNKPDENNLIIEEDVK